MTDNSTKHEILYDDNTGHDHGWDPYGIDFTFSITDDDLNVNHSSVFINTQIINTSMFVL